MDKNILFKRLMAGLFLMSGLLIIGFVVFVLGVDRGFTEPKFQVIVLFNKVGGLIERSPIRISGVNVGVVGEIHFLETPIEGRSLKVNLNIFKKYEFQFRKCSRIRIKTEGVLGQKLVEISDDRTLKIFDVSKPIIGEDPLDVEDMASTITRTALSIQTTATDLRGVLSEWKYISKKTKRVINRVEDKLIDGTLFKIF